MRVLLFVIGFVLTVPVNGQDTRGKLAAAEEAYRSGDHRAALEYYQELERPGVGWQLLYNMGNCHYELGNTADAVLYYERALKLNPRSKRARENLELAKSRIPDRVVAIQEFFLVRWLKAASILLPIYLWGVILVGLCELLGFMLALAIREYRWGQDRVKVIGIAIAIVLAIGPALYARQQYYSDDRGVVMERADVHVAPDGTSQVSKKVGAGETVEILEAFNGLFKVRFVNYEVGWIVEDQVERI